MGAILLFHLNRVLHWLKILKLSKKSFASLYHVVVKNRKECLWIKKIIIKQTKGK